MLFHTAFGQVEETLGGYFAINTTPQYPATRDYLESHSSQSEIEWSPSESESETMNWYIIGDDDDTILPV